MLPTPWKVAFNQRFPEWHPQSRPRIEDAEGNTVLEMPQNVGHPGEFDVDALALAERIVQAVNGYANAARHLSWLVDDTKIV